MPDSFKMRIIHKVAYVVFSSGIEVIDTNDFIFSFSNLSQRWEPKKPAPPVTSILFPIQ